MMTRRLHGMPLAAAITAALLLKLLILYGLWRAFFAQPQAVHMHMPAARVAQHLLGPADATPADAAPADAAPAAPTAAAAPAPAPTPATAPAPPRPPALAAGPFPPPSSKGER